ncbi:MAG: pitrilysin family protein [Saprospiraceae bacterium]
MSVILYYDPSNPLAAVDLHYQVGSRDDKPGQTGMAHLFEHLMFAGTPGVPSFDKVIQNAGGENNAFTTSDSTNYHVTLPSANLEIALKLESDRMQHIVINEKIFNREKQVVLEEYKETCLNKPYGDSFHLLCDLAFTIHPYKWPVIGKNEKAIKGLKIEQARTFYKKYYQPNNAILSINSNIPSAKLFTLVEKYFGSIEKANLKKKAFIMESVQRGIRRLIAPQKGPAEAIYMAFHMESRMHRDFYVADVISDILSNGHSTRLLKNLMRGKKLVSNIDAYITASLDPGLFIIEAKLIPGKSMRELEKAIWNELIQLKTTLIKKKELTKIKNTIESSLVFSEVNGLNRAITLGFFELLGDAHMANNEGEIYQSITVNEIKSVSKKLFRKENCSIVYYKRSPDGQGYFEDEDDDD